jgi:DNA polymerase-3 subunit delta'
VLLKTVEEPPQSTILVLLAETLIPELATIVSRCVEVDLSPVPEDVIAQWLQADGVEKDLAASAAKASGGSPEKARLLVEDPQVGERRSLWRSVPARLDGTGATISTLAAELVERSNEAVEPLRLRHASEIEELAQTAKAMGERGLPGRREIEDRHKREERRSRTDELKAGLAELAAAYRDRAAERSRDPSAHAGAKVHDLSKACDVVGEVAAELIRNPNEGLLLEALFIRLSALSEN